MSVPWFIPPQQTGLSALADGFGQGFASGRKRYEDNVAGRAFADTYDQAPAPQTTLGALGRMVGGGGGFGSITPAAPTSPRAAAVVPQGERASYIRQGLIQRGLPEHVADAFVVNFQDESGLNPDINEANPIVPGSRGGYGLYQLTGPRRRMYEAFARDRGVDTSDIDAQLDFLKFELGGPEARAAQSILGAKDTAGAAQAIVNNFLRPAPEHRQSRAARYANITNSYSPGAVLGGNLSPEDEQRLADMRSRGPGNPANVRPYSGPGSSIDITGPIWDESGFRMPTADDQVRYGRGPSSAQVASADGSGPSPETMNALMSGVNTSRESRGEPALPMAQAAPTPSYQSPDIGSLISGIAAGQTQASNVTGEQLRLMLRSEETRPMAMALWQAKVEGDPRAAERALGLALDLEQQNYGRYRDQVGDARDAENLQYERGRDVVADQRWQQEYELKSRPDPIKPPASVQEYQFAVGQGFQGSFADWEQQNRRAGATSVTVDNGGSGGFFKTLDKANADMFGTLLSSAPNAQTNLARVDRLETMLGELGSGWQNNAALIAGNLGIDIGNAGGVQAAQALINSMVPEQRAPGSGPMSDADLELFKQSLPRIINSPEGNRRIIETLRGISQYQLAQADTAQRVASRQITPEEGNAQLRSLPNPVAWVREAELPAVPSADTTQRVDGVPVGGSSQPPARPTSDAEYNALPSGSLFIDPDDGNIYRKP